MKLKVHGSNQTVLEGHDWEVFFSYETPVVAVHRTTRSMIKVDKATCPKWSVTTSRHVNKYLSQFRMDRFEVEVVDQKKLDNLMENASLWA